MISYIKGILSEIDEKGIVVEAAGVGYGIIVPTSLLSRLPAQGTEVKIYTHLQVSDDAQKLYGFTSAEERELFRKLLTVSGVGPKAAIGVLSVLDADGLRLAILSDDEKSIAKAPGLGQKTARKIILELKDKFNISDITLGGKSTPVKVAALKSGPREDAIAAMVALGYSASESLSAVAGLGDTGDMTSDDILSLALRKVMK